MNKISFSFTLTLSLTLLFCVGNGGGKDEGNHDIQEIENIETDAIAEANGDVCGFGDINYDGEVQINEPFRIIYGYRGRIIGPDGNTDKHDLWLMNPLKPKEVFYLTQFGLKETGYNCNLGCIVDEGINWIALTTTEATELGFNFILGKFNDKLEVSILKWEELENKADYIFDHDVLYFSELNKASCSGQPPSCQYDIYRVEFDPVQKQKILSFPPVEDLKDSVYKGHLRLGMNGKTLILLNPTIRSQTIYTWREGVLVKVDYICPTLGESGQCIGAGSYYSDNDPVNLAPDGENLIGFFLEDREFRVRHYNLKTDAKKYSVMVAVPQDYNKNKCYNKKEWQYTEVVGMPVFTPDSKEVIFIGRTECHGTKPWTNIIRLNIVNIGDGTPLEECEYKKITNNPKEVTAWNVEIRSIDISPEGQWIVFTGTPTWQEDGNLIPDKSQRHLNDNEVWIVSIDGGKTTQLTNEMDFEAKMIKTVPVP